MALFHLAQGEALSPNALRPADEVIYLVSGSADLSDNNESIKAKTGDAVLFPAGSMMMVTNSGSDVLSFLSVSSREGTNKTQGGLILRSPENKTPVDFGNVSTSDQFSVTRLISPFEESFGTSFDLATVQLKAGQKIAPISVDSRQIGYILSGKGNLTIDCVSHTISAGDMFSIPEDVTRKYTADKDLQFILITEPFYTPDKDHPGETNCPE